MSNSFNASNLDQALALLGAKLELLPGGSIRLVVCGGSALIAMRLRDRTTTDVDVVALMSDERELLSPDPLPEFLLSAASQVARDLGLPAEWLNNGPSRGEGGLFQMGLPSGFVNRLTERSYGNRLSVFFIAREDQIHFKLYAAADQRSGAHLNDLLALKPTEAELETAGRWTMTHDVSEGFKFVLKDLLSQIGYESVAQKL